MALRRYMQAPGNIDAFRCVIVRPARLKSCQQVPRRYFGWIATGIRKEEVSLRRYEKDETTCLRRTGQVEAFKSLLTALYAP